MKKKRSNGEGCIYQLNEKWYGVVIVGKNENGTPKKKKITGNKRSEVVNKMKPLLLALQEGSYLEPSSMLFGDWLDIWLKQYKKNVLKDTTYDSYETNIRCHLKTGIGEKTLKDLKTIDIQHFINDKYENKSSTSLLRKLKNIIHGGLKQAVANELIRKNVSENVILPTHKQKDIRVFTKEEERKFIDCLEGDRLAVAFKLDLVSGLRSGELLGLTWDCIDFDNNLIIVKQTLVRTKDRSKNAKTPNKYTIKQTTKTRSGKRKVPIPPTAIVMLKNYKLKQETEKELARGIYKDSNLVFCTELGNRMIPRNAARSFTRLSEKVNIIGASVHSLRHTYATRLFELGVPAKTVSELLGHKNVSHTLDVYTHVLPDIKSKAVLNLDYMIVN